MFRFVWAFHRNTEIISLFLRELRQLYSDFFQVQASDFFVEFFGQTIDADLGDVFILPQIQLREDLVHEAVRHHKARMDGRATEIHLTALYLKIICLLSAFGGI